MPNWTAPAGATVTRAQPTRPRPRAAQPAWCTASDVANIAGRVPCRSAHHGGVGRPGAAVLPGGAAPPTTGRRRPPPPAGAPRGLQRGAMAGQGPHAHRLARHWTWAATQHPVPPARRQRDRRTVAAPWLPAPDRPDPLDKHPQEPKETPRMTAPAYICDALRTPLGALGGALSSVRTDDLGAIPIRALMERNPGVDWAALSDVLYGCANQAGEDNRNVAHMSSLLAGLPVAVPGATINRLCGSGLDAVGTAARAIKAGEADLLI